MTAKEHALRNALYNARMLQAFLNEVETAPPQSNMTAAEELLPGMAKLAVGFVSILTTLVALIEKGKTEQ